jgi:hypothetical protein
MGRTHPMSSTHIPMLREHLSFIKPNLNFSVNENAIRNAGLNASMVVSDTITATGFLK